jgi:cytochrome P450
MLHYLFSQEDDLDKPAYSIDELHTEANLLVIAGFDTVSVTLGGFWFYISRWPAFYDNLVKEVRTTFPPLDDIRSGPLLSSCTYLWLVSTKLYVSLWLEIVV